MTRLEDELRAALERKSPPFGFATRVLARAEEHKVARRRWFQWQYVQASAIAIVIVMIASAYVFFHAHQERARGEAAKAQVMMALRITSAKLHRAEARVQAINKDDGAERSEQ